jgi:hypothetical protein
MEKKICLFKSNAAAAVKVFSSKYYRQIILYGSSFRLKYFSEFFYFFCGKIG